MPHLAGRERQRHTRRGSVLRERRSVGRLPSARPRFFPSRIPAALRLPRSGPRCGEQRWEPPTNPTVLERYVHGFILFAPVFGLAALGAQLRRRRFLWALLRMRASTHAMHARRAVCDRFGLLFRLKPFASTPAPSVFLQAFRLASCTTRRFRAACPSMTCSISKCPARTTESFGRALRAVDRRPDTRRWRYIQAICIALGRSHEAALLQRPHNAHNAAPRVRN